MFQVFGKGIPTLYSYTVFTVFYYLYCRTERLPRHGGRERLLSPEQETEILNMVLENNAITLQIQRKIIENNDIFQNIDRVSLSTLDRVLHRNNLRMKQVYRVPFERNSERVKELRYTYVQVSPIQSHNRCILSTLYKIYTYFSIVIIMIVLHNRDHSMSISDIVMCVSESP